MKPFNCCYRSCLSLSLLFVISIHEFAMFYCEATNATITMLRLLLLYQLRLAEICICHKPWDEMRDLQIALPGTLMLPFFLYFWYSARKTRSQLWGWPFIASFFLPFGVVLKGIQSTQLHCHILFLSFTCSAYHLFFTQPGTVAGFM